ncbi:hypothetical protein D3C86_701310 [compost metagenome]
MADVGQVDAPGGYIGGDEEGYLPFMELADRLDALALLHLATDPGTGDTGRLQLAGELRQPLACLDEDDGLLGLGILQNVDQQRQLVGGVIGQVHPLGDGAALAAGRLGMQLHRIFEDLARELLETGPFQGGGEEHGVLAVARLGHDPVHILDEAHVQHAVRFIQHQHLDVVALELFLFYVLQQATRGGHDYVGGLGQGWQLLFMADAADDGLDAEVGMHRQRPGMGTDLQRQLAGRGQDQHAARARLATREVQQVLHGGQQEGGCLAGTGRSGCQNIAAVQGWLQHHLLNGGGAGETHLGQGPVEGWIQVEIIKGLAHGNTRSLRKRQIIGDYAAGSYGDCGLAAIIADHFRHGRRATRVRWGVAAVLPSNNFTSTMTAVP